MIKVPETGNIWKRVKEISNIPSGNRRGNPKLKDELLPKKEDQLEFESFASFDKEIPTKTEVESASKPENIASQVGEKVVSAGKVGIDWGWWLAKMGIKSGVWIGKKTAEGGYIVGEKAAKGGYWVGKETVKGGYWLGKETVKGGYWVGGKILSGLRTVIWGNGETFTNNATYPSGEVLVDNAKEVLVDNAKEVLVDKAKEVLVDKAKEVLVDNTIRLAIADSSDSSQGNNSKDTSASPTNLVELVKAVGRKKRQEELDVESDDKKYLLASKSAGVILEVEEKDPEGTEAIKKMTEEELEALYLKLTKQAIRGGLIALILNWLNQGIRFMTRFNRYLIIIIPIYYGIGILEKKNICGLGKLKEKMERRTATSWGYWLVKVGVCMQLAGIILNYIDIETVVEIINKIGILSYGVLEAMVKINKIIPPGI